MFLGMSVFQILVVMVVIMLVVGPQKLPEYAKKAGTFMRNVKRYTTDMGKDLTKSIMSEDKTHSSSSKSSSGSSTDLFGSSSKTGKSLSSFLDSNDK